MKTLTQTAPSIHAEAPAVLDPAEVRRAAGYYRTLFTPADIRDMARQAPTNVNLELAAIADAMEELAAAR